MERLEDRSLMAASSFVYSGLDGHLIYQPDAEGDVISDFSHVGYRSGATPPADVPVRAIVSPRGGDDGAAIQAAINTVGVMPLDANGFRGAVLLTEGEYQIADHLSIWASGVVIRGEGDGAKAGTILRATGEDRRTLIYAFGSGTRQVVAGTEHRVAEEYVPAGARSLRLESVAGLAVGDSVVVNRPSPANWIHDVGMSWIWLEGTMDLNSDRVITHIDGNVVMLDAPLTNSLDQQYGGGTLYKYEWPGRIEDVGIENLRAISDYKFSTDENHSWSFLDMGNIQNAWVRNVTTQHFAFSAVNVGRSAKWVTIDGVQGLDPMARTTGGRKYTFNVDGQLTLVKNSYSRRARHDFVVGGNSPGPNVFVDSRADSSLADAGPHQRWSTGILLDNIRVPRNQINIRNRGASERHGWTAANSVVWNSQARSFIVENPPTAQNWLIGSKGSNSGNRTRRGIVESHGRPVTPRSLYYAQLADRQGYAGFENREYRLGDIDGLVSEGAADHTPVDPAWDAALASLAGGEVQGFDSTLAQTPVAFSLDFELAADEQVVGATLHMGLRVTSKNFSDGRVYLDAVDSSMMVKELGWGTIPTNGVAGRVIDLSSHLSQLQDGQFDVALFDDLAVDWATLHLQVAQRSLPPGISFAPLGDSAEEANAAIALGAPSLPAASATSSSIAPIGTQSTVGDAFLPALPADLHPPPVVTPTVTPPAVAEESPADDDTETEIVTEPRIDSILTRSTLRHWLRSLRRR